MKFGPVEGSSEEIKNFFQDNGLKASDYFAPPDAPLHIVWFMVPGGIVVAALSVLALVALPGRLSTLIFLVGCAAGLWLAVNAQIRFKNAWATGVIAVGCLLLMLVALGAVTPVEMLKEVKSLKGGA